MFGRRKKDKGFRTDDILAFLGKGTEFKGILTYDGTVRVDGKIEGEIITAGTLIVGETGQIDAHITAGSVISGGQITGAVTVRKTIRLLATATMDGTLRTPSLTVEPGARFNGSVDMAKEDGEVVRSLKLVGDTDLASGPHVTPASGKIR